MNGFCSEYITLYQGRVSNRRLVAHQAFCLVLAGDEITVINANSETISGKLLVVPSMLAHRVVVPTQALFVFLDPHLPFSRCHRALANRLHAGFGPLQARLTSPESTLPAFEWLVDLLTPQLFQGVRQTDPRVVQLAGYIRQHTFGKLPLRQLAGVVHLSVSRLQHLFAEQVGMNLTRYIHWQRLKAAYSHVLAGNSLTEAAYQGGFADAAHFSRTFSRMFGLPPSQLLLKQQIRSSLPANG